MVPTCQLDQQPMVEQAVAAASLVVVEPDYFCTPDPAIRDAVRALTVVAARAGTPITTAQTAHIPTDHDCDARPAPAPDQEPDALVIRVGSDLDEDGCRSTNQLAICPWRPLRDDG